MKKNIDKKIIFKNFIYISVVIFLIILLIFIFKGVYDSLLQKKCFENSIISFAKKNEREIFSIDKIIFFSSADSKNKTGTASNFTIENLYTYTDIAVFINNNSDVGTLENTLKSIKISNVDVTKMPMVGTPGLYFKSINDFAKSEFNENNKIEDELEYDVTSKDEDDLSKPLVYNNCANPITITYINQNIKTDYTMTDTANAITYNGSLLKRCGVSLSLIESSISFDIDIENNKNQKFKTTVYLDIPFETQEKSIYDGNLIEREGKKYYFYRYE